MTGTHDDGAVVAWRLRTKLPATSPSVIQPPPMLSSSDRELDVWLREAYAELTASPQAPAGDAPPRLSAKALQGRSLIDSVVGETTLTSATSQLRNVTTDGNTTTVQKDKVAQGMSLVEAAGLKTTIDATSVSVTQDQPTFTEATVPEEEVARRTLEL